MFAEFSIAPSFPSGRIRGTAKTVDLSMAVDSGARRAVIHLKQRQQSIRVESDPFLSHTMPHYGALARLVTNAIREVASLASRNATLVVKLENDRILIRGTNALDLPTGDLAIDRKITVQALQLGLVCRLTWEQGYGPQLTIELTSDGLDVDRAILMSDHRDCVAGR